MRNRHKIFIYLRLKTMATEKKQAEKQGSTVSKKNLSNGKNKSGKVVRSKKSTAVKNKIAKERRKVKIMAQKWSDITPNDEDVKDILIGRPKLFKDADELVSLFNAYLISCMERVRKVDQVPVKTEQINADNDKEDLLDKNGKPKKQNGGRIKVENNVIAEFEIKEDLERKTTPSIGGFLGFLGGISWTTRERYSKDEAFSWVIENIQAKLEGILVDQAAKGKYNPQIAQFVLNVHYNRIPKKEVDNNIKGSVFKESDFIKD